MLMYSSPFCRKVMRAPGGMSVKATLDFAMSDSFPKAKALCVKPGRGVSGSYLFSKKGEIPFSWRYR